MNTIETLAIRKATAIDFAYIRKLPVHLSSPAASTLFPRRFRAMLQDRNCRLVVFENEGRLSAFAALNFRPELQSAVRFLVLDYFAVDHFALSQGVAAELEEKAGEIARENACIALLASATGLSERAQGFYQQRGFELNGDTLIKKLNEI